MYIVIQRALNREGKCIGVYAMDGTFLFLGHLRVMNLNNTELLIGDEPVDAK